MNGHRKFTVKIIPPEIWSSYDDSQILKQPICNFGLRVEDTSLKENCDLLYKELEARGLAYKPEIYFGDEWFSPEGMNAIAVPFYLAHPRLKELEKTLMLEVEGGDPVSFMKLLRHEAGHCFEHCYRFSKRRKWHKIFGSPKKEYQPESYRPRPYSRSYVKNLDHWYAQAHPDEDFAETFAVWLDPDRNWHKEYKNWPIALEKLKYIDELAKEAQKIKSKNEEGPLPYSAKNLKTTLEKYYQRRKKANAEVYPDFYDSDLKRIFNGSHELPKREHSSAEFMKSHRKDIVTAVAWSTHERKFTIDGLVKRLTQRCESLDLRVGKTKIQSTIEVSTLLTSLVMTYLFTGKFKRRVKG